jgi:hypothetical protein
MRIHKIVIVAGVLSAALSGCMDLDVTNPNVPDRERVLSRPEEVESLVASSYRQVYNRAQELYPNLGLGAMADNVTGGFFDYSVHDVSTEPRSAWNNSSLNTRGGLAQNPWYDMYGVISSVNDALQVLDEGMVIGDAARTARARAFAKMVQGIAHGYLALLYDQALVVDEDTDLEELDPTAFVPYTEVAAAALAMLDEAIAVAGQASFEIPGSVEWINGIPLSSAGLIRMANSYAARILAYTPRTPAERAAVNWNQVVSRVDGGMQEDLAPEGLLSVWESNNRRLFARVRARPGDHARVDYYAVGPGDISGGFQTWHATPSANRQPFQMDTPDRRTQGAAGRSALGTYFGYNRNSIWAADRGTHRWSWYYFLRSGAGDSYYTGPQPTMTRTEMDLLKAEALIRLGRASEAVPLINLSRVANGELPPVTTDGPPAGDQCVPRKVVSGTCGSLWDALMYEKNVEMTGIEGAVSWWDARGWGILQENTPIHLPIPGRELENLGLTVYTFGGNAGGGAAPAQYNLCPAGVSLPRC